MLFRCITRFSCPSNARATRFAPLELYIHNPLSWPSSPVRSAYNLSNFWSQDDHDTLLKLYDQGKPIPEIAAALGRSLPSVKARLDIYVRNAIGPQNRWAVFQLWTPEQIATLERMCLEGHSYKDIAQTLKRTERSVKTRWYLIKPDSHRAASPSMYIPKSRTPWTAEERQKADELRDEGLTYRAIASRLSRSVPSVVGYLTKPPCTPRPGPLKPEEVAKILRLRLEGLTHAQICRNVGLAIGTVRRVASHIPLARSHFHWKPEHDAELWDLVQAQGPDFQVNTDNMPTLPGRSRTACFRRYSHLLRERQCLPVPGFYSQWTAEEDARILEVVAAHAGEDDNRMPLVLPDIPNRSKEECKTRYFHLRLAGVTPAPIAKKPRWTAEEDARILEVVAARAGEDDNRMPLVLPDIPNRSKAACKIRYLHLMKTLHGSLRRQETPHSTPETSV